MTGFAFVACRTGPYFFRVCLASEGRREGGWNFLCSLSLSVVGGGGGGYGYFLKLHNVILFKNKVNRKQPNTDKPCGTPI